MGDLEVRKGNKGPTVANVLRRLSILFEAPE